MKTDLVRLALTIVLLYFVMQGENWAVSTCLVCLFIRSEWHTFSYIFSPKKRRAKKLLEEILPKY